MINLQKLHIFRVNGYLQCMPLWAEKKQVPPTPMHSKESRLRLVCDDWGRHFAAGDPYGNRTHIFAVRGRRLSRLTKGPGHMTLILYHTFFQIAIVF